MKSPLRIAIVALLAFSPLFCPAQEEINIDSLRQALKNAKHDTTRCIVLNLLVENEGNDSLWPEYNKQMEIIAKKNVDAREGELKIWFSEYYALALNNFGYLWMLRGDIKQAYDFYYRALHIQEEINDKKGIATTYNNLAYLFRQDGNVPKAMESYYNGLKIQLEIGDRYGAATSYNNIGFIFDNQGEHIQALEYYNKSLEIYKIMRDKDGIATCYGNIAYIYKSYGDPSCKEKKEICEKRSLVKAINLLSKAIELQIEVNNQYGLAGSLNVLGGIYYHFGDPSCTDSPAECEKRSREKALGNYQRALKIRLEIGSLLGAAQSYNSLADYMLNTGSLNEALEYGLKSMNAAKELGSAEAIRDAANSLQKIYEKKGQWKEAYEMYDVYIEMRDSVYNDETKKSALKKIYQIEYENEAIKDSIRNVSKLNEERFNNELAVSRQRYYTYGGFIGFALMLLIAVVSIRAFLNKKQANIIITQQKQLTESQKHIIEEKQKEIIDSIAYAKRLQDAILPPDQFIRANVPESFILYKPKDIVSGDFYWAEKSGDLFFIAAADSTGHGVPGAMMSVVCSNALNRAVKEFHLTETGKILDKTRELVLETFEKSSNRNIKDGMDISLLCIDQKNKAVTWSGANNPLWYICNNEFFEAKPDKQAIGKTDDPTPFTTHRIEYKANTTFYLFTDGYADQFGGPNGKKFKYKSFSSLLLKHADAALAEQASVLEQAFTEWKGKLEQVDDVCVIGVRIVNSKR